MHWRQKLKVNTIAKNNKDIAKIKMFKYCEQRGEDSNRAVLA